jgi:hypothetical protein
MAKATKIIRLPTPDFTFEGTPVDEGSFLHRYRENQAFVGAMIAVLRKNSAELKAAMATSDAELGGGAMRQVMRDFDRCSVEFGSLSELFQSASVRMSFVQSHLV